MYKKWIIIGNEFRLGHVDYHADLVSKDEKLTVLGGGYWLINFDKNSILLYSKSEKYGSCIIDDIKKILNSEESYINDKLKSMKWYFSPELSLEQAKKNFKEIK